MQDCPKCATRHFYIEEVAEMFIVWKCAICGERQYLSIASRNPAITSVKRVNSNPTPFLVRLQNIITDDQNPFELDKEYNLNELAFMTGCTVGTVNTWLRRLKYRNGKDTKMSGHTVKEMVEKNVSKVAQKGNAIISWIWRNLETLSDVESYKIVDLAKTIGIKPSNFYFFKKQGFDLPLVKRGGAVSVLAKDLKDLYEHHKRKGLA